MNVDINAVKNTIESGKAVLGVEFGSTRIKAVLIDENNNPVASGNHDWENQYVDNIWTYSLEAIWAGLQDAYAKLLAAVQEKYGVTIKKLGAIGFSAMMHGYMAFNEAGELLVPFRTWRNTITEQSAGILSEAFNFNIPQRWSIAHLYQAILNNEAHIGDIRFITTLAGYIHWQLTGKKVIGIGDASGIFPIDSTVNRYDAGMIAKFDELVADRNFAWKLSDILPEILLAGDNAGVLTEEGARLLDLSGNLEAGAPICPPEGDAGTGMVATNSVAKRTGNISAGTSIFAMIVLEKALSQRYEEIDMVTTPDGAPVAMVHCNNCTSDLNAWVKVFEQFARVTGSDVSRPAIFDAFYYEALKGDPDCGGLLSYGYFSGEHITGFEEGRPLFVRSTNSNFSFSNLARAILFSALGALKIGLDILLKKENVQIDSILGHGGLYKTKDAGQMITAAAINAPVSVMETAGEGGAWGIAVLASYMINKADGESLGDYLGSKVFAGNKGSKIDPDPAAVEGFNAFIETYKAGLPIERAAVDSLK
ncbi:MAG: FGGY-family carbohydrate kinase [Clostridia bacterium]|nr:FGGY-family carbohydrate kinase [Clostridia bacterium]